MTRLAILVTVAAKVYEEPLEVLFQQFIKKFDKNYDEKDVKMRKTIFEHNLALINEENGKGTNSFTLGIGPFADQTLEEFRSHHGTHAKRNDMGKPGRKLTKEMVKDTPASVDWVKDGAVTSVKNQGQCGSCWSFSATGAIEGAYAISRGELLDLSEQNMIDCDKVDSKCNGGLMDNAFQYVIDNGLCTLKSDPYKCANAWSWSCYWSKCEPCSLAVKAGDVTEFVDVEPESVKAMEGALAKGPVSVAIEADTSVFQLYSGGILPAAGCGKNLDHGVLAVGYGEENGTEYWTVKNSWSENWGENGYIRFAKSGKVPSEGTCGILLMASYPVFSEKFESEIYL